MNENGSALRRGASGRSRSWYEAAAPLNRPTGQWRPDVDFAAPLRCGAWGSAERRVLLSRDRPPAEATVPGRGV